MSNVDQRTSPGNEPLSTRLEKIRQRMKKAAEKSGRDLSSIRLVAVTKTVAPTFINEAIQLGVTDLGENKVQEAQKKRPEINLQRKALQHHLIGHLQSNKARKALELFNMIQSVDSPSLASTLDRIAAEKGTPISCLVEVKLGNETTKTGVPLKDAPQFIKQFSAYKNLLLSGLMTIAPLNLSEDETRACFRSMKTLFDEYRSFFGEKPVLSMGMSDDFELAIEEGSTMVRLGRALFGERFV